MSDENEKSGDNGVAKAVGGIAAGGGVFYAMDKSAKNKGIEKVLSGDKNASKKLAGKVNEVLKTDSKLASHKEGMDILNSVKDPKKLGHVEFTAAGEKGLHTMDWKLGQKINGVDGVKLPKDIAAGKKLIGTDAAKAFEATRTASQKEFVKDISKAGKMGVGTGFGASGAGGKGKIIVGTVAAVVAGGIVAHKLFGGKHSNKEAERKVQQDLGAYR